MKPFESFLAAKMDEYIHYCSSLGYTTKNIKSYLLHFDRYVRKMNGRWDCLQPAFFLEFIQSLKKEATTVNKILCGVRGFFQFLVRQDILGENPLHDIPPLKEHLFIPFVFSPHESERLISTVRERIRKIPNYFLNDFSVYMAILLQTLCGLRISEPTCLLRSHYRPKERTIYIEKTKFKKDRLLPIPEALAGEILNYLAVRNSLVHDDHNPHLLYGGKQKRLSVYTIYSVFKQAVRDCGLYQPRRMIGTTIFGSPTPHSLRHSFAINTLKRIKDNGKSPQAALPVLAAYMGHRNYQYTAVYLKVLDAHQRKGLLDSAISHQGEI